MFPRNQQDYENTATKFADLFKHYVQVNCHNVLFYGPKSLHGHWEIKINYARDQLEISKKQPVILLLLVCVGEHSFFSIDQMHYTSLCPYSS